MTLTPTRRRTAVAAAAVALALVVAGCGDDDGDTEASDTSTTAAEADAGTTSEGGLDITGAWSRTTAPGQENGAVYMTVTAEADDAIVGASVPADIAGTVELHETVPADEVPEGSEGDMGEGDMGSDESTTTMAEGGDESTTTAAEDDAMTDDTAEDDGMGEGMDAMAMVPVESIELPAGEAVTLEPGGLHIMLLDLPAPLAAGDTFTVTLELESGESVDVEVEVADQAP